jgi:hypothetical protein
MYAKFFKSLGVLHMYIFFFVLNIHVRMIPCAEHSCAENSC